MSSFPRIASTSLALVLAAGAVGACDRRAPAPPAGGAAPAEAAPAAPAPPHAPAAGAPVPTVTQLVDSALRAFRAGLDEPRALAGGAPSREGLAERFVQAAAAADTATLGALLVTRAEFAWLYFPHARIARPPYGIDPAFLWLQMGSNTSRDLPKATRAIGGGRYAGLACPESAAEEGPNRVHERCLVIVARGGAVRDTVSLFGSILERDGRFKFLSYANRL